MELLCGSPGCSCGGHQPQLQPVELHASSRLDGPASARAGDSHAVISTAP
eukprot:COSAG06_NODE_3021_length_5950_cov_3.010938_1_plen_49_part_10